MNQWVSEWSFCVQMGFLHTWGDSVTQTWLSFGGESYEFESVVKVIAAPTLSSQSAAAIVDTLQVASSYSSSGAALPFPVSPTKTKKLSRLLNVAEIKKWLKSKVML